MTCGVWDEWTDEDLVSRREELAEKWLRGAGIEIGALHVPVRVSADVTVRYVDYKTRAENRDRYPELSDHEIVETDIVDDGFILGRVPDGSQNFLIANHALEHSPDPYGTLSTWARKIKPGGILYFAVPIADRCYDRGRPITSIEHLFEDHAQFSRGAVAEILRGTEAHLLEFLNISDRNIRRDSSIEHIPDDAENEARCQALIAPLITALRRGQVTYQDLIRAHVEHLNRVYDVHYHTFSPASFMEFLVYFSEQQGCVIEEVRKSGGMECIAVLRRKAAGWLARIYATLRRIAGRSLA